MLASYEVSSDLADLRMSEATCLESMYKLCKAMIMMFGKVYLRETIVADVA
jgi:hypothetical protein